MNGLFNKNGEGSRELVGALGMVSDQLDFSKWEPVIPLAARQVAAVIGADVLCALENAYREGLHPELVYMAQRAVAFFAWVKVIPTLDAQHGSSGRQKRLGENEKGLTALQEYKDEANILNLAYESLDALVERLETENPSFWENSEAKRKISVLLVRNKQEFDEYYHIGSHRLFLTLIPIIREVQQTEIVPVVGWNHLQDLLDRREGTESLLAACRLPLVLLTMKKAVERLPVEVIPEGIVQVQQTGTLKEKLRAEKEARRSVAESLGKDAERYLASLQDMVAGMDCVDGDDYIVQPTLQSKGITF